MAAEKLPGSEHPHSSEDHGPAGLPSPESLRPVVAPEYPPEDRKQMIEDLQRAHDSRGKASTSPTVDSMMLGQPTSAAPKEKGKSAIARGVGGTLGFFGILFMTTVAAASAAIGKLTKSMGIKFDGGGGGHAKKSDHGHGGGH